MSVNMTTEEVQKRLEDTYGNGAVRVADMNGNQTNYQVLVESPLFAGKTRIKQHQEVMALFSDELASGEIHAFTIKTVVKN